ncbi:hypothetical protein B9Z55_012444 [Caenorhabditis nigoni]|uniref:DUF19 domain-containing protein n=1 Tax=Caenorhabditis nigoni TaxID=1611254 RepID=A0A2G5TXE5_9PELO|nr:hypothetical protein B9Z55_012444 [Caenorhabditis nigoni]
MISYIFLLLLLSISIYGQEDQKQICLRNFEKLKTCMDKFPLTKEIGYAPFSEEAENEQFIKEMDQLSKCLDHGDCPALLQFQLYADLTSTYAMLMTDTTVMTPEIFAERLKICNERPRPPSDHVESPCNKYSDSCLTQEIKEQHHLALFQLIQVTGQQRCKIVERNRENWSHYFDLVDMKIDFPF